MAGREKLTSEAIDAFLRENEGWALDAGAIRRTFTFPRYADGVAFAVRLAFASEARDHHPDILISWRDVKVGLWTFDAGGITALDLEMAREIDELAKGR